MLAEIIKITIPEWAYCIGWGILFTICLIAFLWIFYRFVVVPSQEKINRQFAALRLKNGDSPQAMIEPICRSFDYQEVGRKLLQIPYSDGGMQAMSIIVDWKNSCSVCNNKGTIKGRQCSCQVAKCWKDKCRRNKVV